MPRRPPAPLRDHGCPGPLTGWRGRRPSGCGLVAMRMDHGTLPEGLVVDRTTPEFDVSSVPAGLLRAHRIAAGVWGVLRVTAGSLRFVWEGDEVDGGVLLAAGDSIVIPPEAPHRVEPSGQCRFVVEFHR